MTMAILTVMLLSACVKPQMAAYIFRENTSVSKADRDHFECEVKAAQSVPTDTRISTTSSYQTPLQTTCYGSGFYTTCTTTGGQTVGGETSSYDANEGLRGEFWSRCMADKGYVEVPLAVCDTQPLSEDAIDKLRARLRSPKDGACYVRITDRIGNIVYASEVAAK